MNSEQQLPNHIWEVAQLHDADWPTPEHWTREYFYKSSEANKRHEYLCANIKELRLLKVETARVQIK